MTDLELMTSGDLGSDTRRSPRPWGYADDLGRYWLPDPADPAAWEPGSIGARNFPRGYMRTTNLISAYVDTRALSIWEQHKMLRGLRARPEIYSELHVAELDDAGDLTYAAGRRIAEAALNAGGADAAAREGTAQHSVMEHRLRTGELIGTPEMQHKQLALERLLSEHLLRPVPEFAERIVVNTHLKCAGRYDVALEDVDPDWGAKHAPGSSLLMGDLKTKKKDFWTIIEQRAQFATYARADAMWDEVQQCYVPPPPFDLDRGILLHLPQKQEELPEELRKEPRLLRMDLRAGWATACRAREVVDDRAGAKSAPMLREIVMQAPELLSLRHWRARLSLVTDLREGSELLSLAAEKLAPEDMVELNVFALEVAQRISGRQLTS